VVTSETILQVTKPKQQCQSTQGHMKEQSSYREKLIMLEPHAFTVDGRHPMAENITIKA